MDDLNDRRNKHSLKFAKICLRNEKVRDFFPAKMKNTKSTRNHEKYIVQFAKAERYRKSTIPTLLRMVNDHVKERNSMLTVFSDLVVVQA